MSAKDEIKTYKIAIPLQAYSLKELAAIYGVCKETLRKWLEPYQGEIGQRRGNYYTIPQVRIIFERLSLPANIKE